MGQNLFLPSNEPFQRGVEGIQNALLTKSRLASAGLDQQQQGMQNQQMAQGMQKRAELEAVLRSSQNPERDGYEWAKRNDPELATKLGANYISRFAQKARLDPKNAAMELENATGERIELGNRYSKLPIDGGEAYVDNFSGYVFQPSNAKELAQVRANFAMELEKLRQDGRKELEGLKTDKVLSPTELFDKDPQKFGAMKEIEAKMRAKYRAPQRDPSQPTPYQRVRTEVDLRKEFNSSPIVKEYDDVRKQMARVESAIEQAKTSKNFIAIDQALINGLNKMIDPQSVVREGEYARTIQNSPILSRIAGKVDQVRSGGGGFTDQERNALVSMMRDFYRDAEGMYSTHASEYERLAEGSGIDKSRIVIQRDKIGPKGGGAAAGVQRSKSKSGKPIVSRDGGKTWEYE